MTDVETAGTVATIVTGVFGLFVGSFLNVVIYRVPAGRSIGAPPSACPRCNARIRWYDNIPVISWVVLKGKCRDCREPISVRYPLIELGTAVLFGTVAVRFLTAESLDAATILELVAFLYLAAVSVALAMIDLDTNKLPNKIVLPAYLVGIVLLGVASLVDGDGWPLARAGIGMAALFVLYLLLAIIRPGGMGMGDVKLAGVLGLFLGWLGWGSLVVGAFAAFLLGGVFAIILLLAGKAGRKSSIPFGPWMLAGAWVGVLVGNILAGWYLGVVGLA